MSTLAVTGKTKEELAELREKFDNSNKAKWYKFEEWYCLAKIPRQPEDYDGPDRYCVNTQLRHGHRCKFHGGASPGHPETLEDPALAPLKHGMNANRDTLRKAMERDGGWQVDLYDEITRVWPRAYNIDLAEDPLAAYEFHALALEIIRAERAEGYVFDEGEKGRKKVFGPDGSVHYEDVPHYLADMMQRQRKLIMQMEDNLGISRKARLKADEATDVTDIMKSFAQVGSELIKKADRPFNPDEWDPDDLEDS